MQRAAGYLAGLAVILVLATAAAAPAAGLRLPTLRLTSGSPVTVAGDHFLRGERVRVRLGSTVLVVHADRTGSFVARFAAKVDRCSGTIDISAAGARGDRATLKTLELACPPAP